MIYNHSTNVKYGLFYQIMWQKYLGDLSKYLGELSKIIGWVDLKLGWVVQKFGWVDQFIFGWVGFWVSCPDTDQIRVQDYSPKNQKNKNKQITFGQLIHILTKINVPTENHI